MTEKPQANMDEFAQLLSSKANELADAMLDPEWQPDMPLMTATLKNQLAAMSEGEREKTMDDLRKNASNVLASQRTEFDQDL